MLLKQRLASAPVLLWLYAASALTLNQQLLHHMHGNLETLSYLLSSPFSGIVGFYYSLP